ncbi:MAG: hypothetical protein ACFB50_07035 [Rubrobacteraceae bacterium]
MNRLTSAMRLDLTVQLRNNLYAIGIGAGVLVAVALSQLASPDQMSLAVPALMLVVVGGSTLLYVAGMIIFEQDEGTLSANIVSPLRISEYLGSKLITLTALATLESLVMIGGAMLIMSFSAQVSFPNVPLLLGGILAIGVIYTLIGIVLIVRYESISDFLLPMSAIATMLQLPSLYFLGWVEPAALLVIPTSGPGMLMRGAYVELASWEWLYGIGYTAAVILGLTVWAYRAFQIHVVKKVG